MLRQALTRQYPRRDFEVYGGDCNDTISGVLRDLRPVNWAPTFAFIDQQSTELLWETLGTGVTKPFIIALANE